MKRTEVSVGFIVLFCFLLLLGCAGQKPSSFVQTAEPGWKVIVLRDKFQRDYDLAYKAAADVLASNYDLEIMNKEIGYLRTGWMHTAVRSEQMFENYRTRVTLKFSVDKTKLRIKAEAHWIRGAGWLRGYDQTILDQVYNDLQGTLGRVVR